MTIEELREKRDYGRKVARSFSLSKGLIKRYTKFCIDNHIKVSDCAELAFDKFLSDMGYGKDLETYTEDVQQPCQTAR
jgi:hypothetical protein